MTTSPLTQEVPPMLVTDVEVLALERLSTSFVRVELGSPVLADFGVDGPLYDQRIKLVFPGASGRFPELTLSGVSWYADWLALPEDERGYVRTYTVRAVRGARADTRLVVDFVLHPSDAGPGSAWAAQAAVGDRLVTVAPRRGMPFGGIEFAPGGARELLLVGDETAVPAVCAILEELGPEFSGRAFLEVPHVDDVLPVSIPSAMTLEWLPRSGRSVGDLLRPAVVAYVGDGEIGEIGEVADLGDVPEGEVDPDLWETPTYSSSGEPVVDAAPDLAGLYAWVAGEAGVVTSLRRHLVRECGMTRQQVAFMGYWRRGVALG